MSDDFATYQDYQDMLDDRDDTLDKPAYAESYDYCPHGVYVGGCGIDWMCDWCESGISVQEARRIVTARETRETRERAERAALMLAKLLETGEIGGIDAAYFAQRSSYVGNPLTRYGRH